MTKVMYEMIESFMLEKMNDSAHDCQHVYRVLGLALEIAANEIAAHEPRVNDAILITACLLHDIGREAQNQDHSLDHALVGGQMAYEYLISIGWSREYASHVRACIETHRYRKTSQPQSIEAKILFDADKLEVCGAIGIARTFLYEGLHAEPMYVFDESGEITLEGTGSFFQEFNYKLRKIYGGFYTKHATEMAEQRRDIAIAVYDNLLAEVKSAHAAVQKIDDILV